jgi:hypothetical protein
LNRHHPLLLRYALVNVVALGLTWAAYIQGWLDGFWEPRTWIMALAIAAVFLWGLGLAGYRIFRVSHALDALGRREGVPADIAHRLARLERADPRERPLEMDMARMEYANQIGSLRFLANALVFLGLIGTVIGFIIGLSGIDAAATSDVDKIAPMITELINGMSVALYTTLLGAVLNIWLNVNLRILSDGAVRLLRLLLERATHTGEAGDGAL